MIVHSHHHIITDFPTNGLSFFVHIHMNCYPSNTSGGEGMNNANYMPKLYPRKIMPKDMPKLYPRKIIPKGHP